MYIFLIVIHIISCIVLVLTILLQSGKGGGLSESFGAGSTSTIFGTSATNFMQKATAVCAIVFLVTSLSLAMLSSRKSKSLMQLDKIKRVLPQAERQMMPQDIEKAAPVKGPDITEEAFPIEEAEIPITE
ncbi:MAG: preprotein translocase subunit SecG [Candidatus Omnitrophota bacterium]